MQGDIMMTMMIMMIIMILQRTVTYRNRQGDHEDPGEWANPADDFPKSRVRNHVTVPEGNEDDDDVDGDNIHHYDDDNDLAKSGVKTRVNKPWGDWQYAELYWQFCGFAMKVHFLS